MDVKEGLVNKVVVVIAIVVIVIVGAVITIKNQNAHNVNKTADTVESEDIKSEGKIETIGDVKFKVFDPLESENGGVYGYNYDLVADMIYNNKVYYKKVTTYEQYLIYKSKWNGIYDLLEEDFENSFMVITAIENVSMLGLTLTRVEEKADTLYLYLGKYPENVEYNEKNTGISIVIPKSMDKKNVIAERITDEEIRSRNNDENVQVSNSDTPTWDYVIKPFDVLKTDNNDVSDLIKDGKFYKKKITTYGEYLKYKEKWKEIRELTNKDFVNYHLLLVLSENVSSKYALRKMNVSNIILYKLDDNTNAEKLLYAGLAIVMPNDKEAEIADIQIVDETALNEVKINEEQAKETAIQALKDDGIKTWSEMTCEQSVENFYYLERRNDFNTDYANKYEPVTEYKYVKTWHVLARDADNPGCGVNIWIDITTGELLCYHWSGE